LPLIRKATEKDAQKLSEIFDRILKDKDSEGYKANVERYGIPEEYVKKVFSKEALKRAVDDKNMIFLVAVRENGEIIGFAQTILLEPEKAELDRIFLVPNETGKGVGTQLLQETIRILRKHGITKLTVRAGKDETLARRFYEKNGFKMLGETTIKAPWGKEISLALYELPLISEKA
jgi:N-acetylglutamate synthase-like GNAT family acetyltransferase